MKIHYILRAPSKERSIERVFGPVIQYMKAQGNKVESSFVKSWKLWPCSMLYNMLWFSFSSYLRKRELFHITGDVQYVACWMNPANTVLTIHDCVTLHNENTSSWFKKLVYRIWYEKPLKRLKKITCISEATRQDLISIFPWVVEKLVVVPNSVGSEFQYTPKPFATDYPRILHVGTRCNKNLERVIQALEGLSCKLIVIGKLTDEQTSLLCKHKINYENRCHISDQEIVATYKEADIISFPSLFEGFGMPIIEGQIIGRPVLTSDREPMRSVAGEGALLVNPESVESIRGGFVKLLTDTMFYDSVSHSGRLNAQKYNINTVCVSYMMVYTVDI